MAWSPAHKAKIIRRGDQTAAEVIVPDTVGQNPWRKRVTVRKNPLGKRKPSIAFGRFGRQIKGHDLWLEKTRACRPDRRPFFLRIAPQKNMLFFRWVYQIPDPPRGEGSRAIEFPVDLGNLLIDFIPLLFFFLSCFTANKSDIAVCVIDRFPIV